MSCGLTFSLSHGGVKKTSRGAVRTAALGVSDFPISRHVFMWSWRLQRQKAACKSHQNGTPQRRKIPQQRQKGEDAKG